MKLIIVPIATFAALTFTCAAFGQYIWVDENGVKQFSDMAPPASVPDSRILKAPPRTLSKPASASAAAEGTEKLAAQAAPEGKAPATIAEKNVDFAKRKAEQAEKEKKAADEAARIAANAKNCERAREYQAMLDSGRRISRVDKSGQPYDMTDQQRNEEVRNTKKILGECK